MPTSATGSSRSAGFTLVEMMVVLAILGLMTAVVAVNLPGSEDGLVRDTEKLAARLLAARDNAIVGNRETAAVLDAGGYRFVVRDGKAWREIDDKPLTETRWKDGTSLAAGESGTVRVSFDTVGMSEAKSVILKNGDHRRRLSIAASGAVSIDAAR